MKPILSTTMEAALLHAKKHHGTLVRHPGGFWTAPGDIKWECGRPTVPYFGSSTIEALVSRGVLYYSRHVEGINGIFPVEVEVNTSDEA